MIVDEEKFRKIMKKLTDDEFKFVQMIQKQLINYAIELTELRKKVEEQEAAISVLKTL